MSRDAHGVDHVVDTSCINGNSVGLVSIRWILNIAWELLRAPNNIAGTPSKQTFWKTLLPEEEGVIPEELRGTYSERRVFRKTTFFFRKKVLPEFVCFFKILCFSNYLILINKLRYKINNIIIHKLLVNIIMTNICNSFFTRM